MGMTPEEGWVNDDGISHKTGGRGLDLVLTYSEGAGMHAVSASVVLTDIPSVVAEDVEEENLEEDIMFEVLESLDNE